MDSKELKVPFQAPLNKNDTDQQTEGCRANNPDICAHCYVPGICAFVSSDGICRHPSKAWKKQKEILTKRYSNLDINKLFIVQYEIESWYYAGASIQTCQKLKLKQYVYNTDGVALLSAAIRFTGIEPAALGFASG